MLNINSLISTPYSRTNKNINKAQSFVINEIQKDFKDYDIKFSNANYADIVCNFHYKSILISNQFLRISTFAEIKELLTNLITEIYFSSDKLYSISFNVKTEFEINRSHIKVCGQNPNHLIFKDDKGKWFCHKCKRSFNYPTIIVRKEF